MSMGDDTRTLSVSDHVSTGGPPRKPPPERGLAALERYRVRNGYTKAYFAEVVLGLNRTTYWGWFNGREPSREHCALVLAKTNVDITPRRRRR